MSLLKVLYWISLKDLIYFLQGVANVLIVISGALFIPQWETIVVPIVARYIGGLGQGITFIPLLVHTSEVATKNLRGAVVAVTSCMVATSLFVASWFLSVFSLVDSPNFMDQIIGGMIVLYGLMGLAFLKCFTFESPVFLIKNNQEQDAFNTLKRLRLETQDSYEVHQDFQDLKDLINDEKCLERVRFSDKGLRSFCRILLLRILYVFSISMLLLRCQLAFSLEMSTEYGFGILMTGRFIAEMLAMYLIEKRGRRKILLVSSTICGLLLVLSGITAFSGTSFEHSLIALAVFSVIYQTVLGFGLSPVSFVYLSELFSLKRKAVSIMAIMIIENLFQIMFVLIGEYVSVHIPSFLFITGVIQIGGGVYLYKTLPETKGLSLRECLHAVES